MLALQRVVDRHLRRELLAFGLAHDLREAILRQPVAGQRRPPHRRVQRHFMGDAVLLEADQAAGVGQDHRPRRFDKDDEYEADRMGVVITACSGYSLNGLVGVLQTLAAAAQDHSVALIYKTHPLTGSTARWARSSTACRGRSTICQASSRYAPRRRRRQRRRRQGGGSGGGRGRGSSASGRLVHPRTFLTSQCALQRKGGIVKDA
jgi:hypothetical protein